jgi:hypothetical protein
LRISQAQNQKVIKIPEKLSKVINFPMILQGWCKRTAVRACEKGLVGRRDPSPPFMPMGKGW